MGPGHRNSKLSASRKHTVTERSHLNSTRKKINHYLKILNRIDCQRSEKKKGSKTHTRLKKRFLTGRNRTKRASFQGSPLFQATYDTKTEIQQLIQLILCHLDV